MRNQREQLFRCEFVGESLHVYSHVRAWDAPEALSAFVEELKRDGIRSPGEIEVTCVHGRAPAVRARYGPGRTVLQEAGPSAGT